ncbi:MAG: hypothetical protein JSW12_19470 [Deltaproteobacteria bacterium]|nr:MAG: hypothetical protein JSW12_19470 [Deltaproteobacteria bacterium]
MDITPLFSLNTYTFNPLALANFLFTGVLLQLGLATVLEPKSEIEIGQVSVNRAWFADFLVVSVWQFLFGLLYLSRGDVRRRLRSPEDQNLFRAIRLSHSC